MAKKPVPTVTRAVDNVDGHIQALTAEFTNRMNPMLMRAQARTLSILQQNLTFGRGRIEATMANRRILAGAAKLFVNEMNGAGYDSLINAWMAQWGEMFPLFQETLNAITETFQTPPEPIHFGPEDLRLFQSRQIDTRIELTSLVDELATEAQNKLTFSYGGMSYSDLTQVLARYTGQSLPQAEGLAATATSSFYRTIADRGFLQIEKQRGPLRYRYMGPNDFLTRPFCVRVLRMKSVFTRDQIAKMNAWPGHSLPDVMTTCGGYRCRHQFVMATGQ